MKKQKFKFEFKDNNGIDHYVRIDKNTAFYKVGDFKSKTIYSYNEDGTYVAHYRDIFGHNSKTKFDKSGHILTNYEGDKLILLNEYDDNGNIIHSINAVTEREEYRKYDNENRLINNLKITNYPISDSENDFIFEEWYEHDKNGNIIHYKNNKGYEEWKEYNDNNKVSHIKNNDGYEEWYEHDKNGNIIHYKNNKGYEEWYEYDYINYTTKCRNSKKIETKYNTININNDLYIDDINDDIIEEEEEELL